MTLDELLSRLDTVRQRGNGRYAARCPAHLDKSPSLSISEGDKGLLLRCFAGCTVEEISKALGIEQRDLFYDSQPDTRGHRPAPRPVKMDRVALAFRYDLAALDLRLRAERIVEVGMRLDVASLNDSELDRALHFIAKAHDDEARAELFESVADTLRERDSSERNTRERHTRVA